MNHTQAEQWRPIPGYEGYYEVSSQGRVRSVDRVTELPCGQIRRYKGRILKLGTHPKGHKTVSLYKGDKRRCTYVHTLVLETFIGPRPQGAESLHYDDNPANNHVENLRWGTRQENVSDMLRNGKHYQANQTHCKHGHEFTPENTMKNGPTGRGCRTCNKARSRAWQRKHHT